MRPISCSNCGVVVDGDKLKPEPLFDLDGMVAVDGKFTWDKGMIVDMILCPGCGERGLPAPGGERKGYESPMSHRILAGVVVGITELKKNPMAAVTQGGGGAVAVLNRNEPVFYVIPTKVYEHIYEILEDVELRVVVEARKSQPEVEGPK